jgi:hypothetical protein
MSASLHVAFGRGQAFSLGQYQTRKLFHPFNQHITKGTQLERLCIHELCSDKNCHLIVIALVYDVSRIQRQIVVNVEGDY